MKNKAYDLTTYAFKKNEALLLDANVWLFLFSAPSDKAIGYGGGYSAALKRMLAARCCLVMDALVLSEYLNRYCRIEWNALHKAAEPDFKKFRNSAAFHTVGQGATTYARSILQVCTRYDHPFATADVMRVLTEFETGAGDFNDGLLAESCRHHNWKLVTHDGDFTAGGIEVLTTNPRLLAACP